MLSTPSDQSSFNKYFSIPEPVRTFLESTDVLTRRVDLGKRFFTAADQMPAFVRIINRLYDKEITLADIEAEIGKATRLTPDKVNAVLLEIAGYEFLPISDYLGDVEGFIRKMGGDPKNFAVQRITLREMTPQEVVSEVLKEHPVNVPAHLDSRMRDILENRVRAVRKDDDTVLRLTRAEKIGGCGIDEPVARMVVEAVVSKKHSVNLQLEGPKPSVLNVPSPPIGDPANAAPAPGQVAPVSVNPEIQIIKPTAAVVGAGIASVIDKKTDAPSKSDEQEVQTIREQVLPAVSSKTGDSLGVQVEREVRAVIAALQIPVPPTFAERFQMIVVSFLRGVRMQRETRDLLTRDPQKGGMGFGTDLADRVVRALEVKINERATLSASVAASEKEQFVRQSANVAVQKETQRQGKEQQELNELYASITKKPISAIPPLQQSAQAVGGAPTLDDAPDFAAMAASEAPALSRAPEMPNPKMQDVRVVQRLVGPIEELRNFTVMDFRRLSSDPNEATLKLADKIDLLEGQSYVKRLEGIDAWKESEVQNLYLSLIGDSFAQAKPIAGLIREREAQNQPTLTEREVDAIREFNKKLKF